MGRKLGRASPHPTHPARSTSAREAPVALEASQAHRLGHYPKNTPFRM